MLVNWVCSVLWHRVPVAAAATPGRRLNHCAGQLTIPTSPRVYCRLEAVQLMHFAPCVMLGESSAHADRIMQNAPRRNVPLVALFQLVRWFVSGCLRRSSVA